MASLTPLSKCLIAVAVVGAMASAVWHLGLKGWLADRDAAAAAQASVPATGIQQPFPTGGNGAPPVIDVPVAVPPAAPPAPPVAVQAPPPDVRPSGSGAASRLSAAENYETGARLLRDGKFAQARQHLEQAVKDESGPAACLLGEMTLKGQGGLSADQDKAAGLFRLAQSRDIICFASGG